jgi:hypothetical protein
MPTINTEKPPSEMGSNRHGSGKGVAESGAVPATLAAQEPVTSRLMTSLPYTQRDKKRLSPVKVAYMNRETAKPQLAGSIEPYRNGQVATHLTGEALRLALIEDRRLTSEANKASLRAIQSVR